METTQSKYTSKTNSKYLLFERVHTNPCINSSKVAVDYNFVKTIFPKGIRTNEMPVSSSSLSLELTPINELKKDLFEFLQNPLSNTDLYKKKMKGILFDKRIKYSPLRAFDNYEKNRRHWKGNKWHLIDLNLLKTEYNALDKLYNDLFSQELIYTFKVNDKVELSVSAPNKEKAFELLSNLPPYIPIVMEEIRVKSI